MILLAIKEESFTIISILKQFVVLHIPSALTQYIVVLAGLTVDEVPELINVPPQETVYQYQLAAVPRLPPVILKLEEEPLQIY